MNNTKQLYDEVLSYEEIAEITGQKPKTVFMIKKRAMDKIKTMLAEKGYKASDFFGEDK
jgi:DNA-directed RNA polymerase specialized sigma24 family protein